MELALTSKELTALYRVALLLTGSAQRAETAVISACTECAPRIESYRNASGRTACLLMHVRESCLKKQPASAVGSIPDEPRGESVLIAGQISALPEPERSALALFYAADLPTREIASLLKLSIEEFSDRLESARSQLRRSGNLTEPLKAEPAL